MKKLFTISICLCALAAFALDDAPKPATAAEAAAGIIKNKYLSPFTGKNAYGGTNAGIATMNGRGTNTTLVDVALAGTNFYSSPGATQAGLLVKTGTAGGATNQFSVIGGAARIGNTLPTGVLQLISGNNISAVLYSNSDLSIAGLLSVSNNFVSPTNAPANGDVITATGTGGSTKYAAPSGGGGDTTNTYNTTITTNSYTVNGKNNTLLVTNNITVLGSVTYSTNAHASATNMLDMSKSYADFTATTAMAITNFSNIDPTKENSSVLMVTNGSGGDLVMNLTSGVTTMDGARTCVMTNNTVTIFSFSVYGNRFTNVAYRTFY